MKKIQIMETENWYAHRKRLFWINQVIDANESWLDVGCGTGLMLTIPLNILNKNVYGIDIAKGSIDGALELATEYNIPKDRFFCNKIENVKMQYDGVIVSEVLEHICSEELGAFADEICKHVAGGQIDYYSSQWERKLREGTAA